jgi:hypothetical protein
MRASANGLYPRPTRQLLKTTEQLTAIELFNFDGRTCIRKFLAMDSASSFETPSLTAFGAPSTRSFALSDRAQVISRTTLMTLILLPPALAE